LLFRFCQWSPLTIAAFITLRGRVNWDFGNG
jgi:hypothetical protein